MTRPSAEAVLKAHNKALMALPGVVGTGVSLCDGSPCIKVYVVRPLSRGNCEVPACIDGYPVEIEATGAIEPRH